MTDIFRRDLLAIDRRHFTFLRSHSTLLNMQTIFAYLVASHRPSYGPRTFIQSLPEMFRDWTQQDAGEFAKYVLDIVGGGLNKYKIYVKEQEEKEQERINKPPISLFTQPTITTPTSSSSSNDSILSPLSSQSIPLPPSSSPSPSTSSTVVPMDVDIEGMKGGDGPKIATSQADSNASSETIITTLSPQNTAVDKLASSALTKLSEASGIVDPTVSSSAVTHPTPSSSSPDPSTIPLPSSSTPTAPSSSSTPSLIDMTADAYFGGELLSTIRCLTCDHISEKTEPFLELPLALEIEQQQITPASAHPTQADQVIDTSSDASASTAATNFLPHGTLPSSQVSTTAESQPTQPTSQPQSQSSTSTSNGLSSTVVNDARINSIISGFLGEPSSTSIPSVSTSGASSAAVPLDSSSTNATGDAATATATANAAAKLAASCMLSLAAHTMVAAAASAATSAGAMSSSAQSQSSSSAQTPVTPAYVVPSGPLHLSSMLAHYFSPETLSDSNAVTCARCHVKRTSTKQLRVMTPAPKHLLICLKRNKYEMANGQIIKSKIMKEVLYPCVLKLPVIDKNQTGSNSNQPLLYKTYILYSVIFHSGVSVQQGHYYTITRHSDLDALTSLSPSEYDSSSRLSSSSEVDPELEQHARSGPWHKCNDAVVTPATFEEMQQVTTNHPTHVAYLLFYRAIEPMNLQKEKHALQTIAGE